MQPELVSDLVVHLLRNADTARVCERFDSRIVTDDFRKTLLMILGIVILGFGFDLFMSFFGGDLSGVMVYTGSGMSLMCAGLYVVKRFAW